MERRETFNNAAKVYDETRPSYPDEVIYKRLLFSIFIPSLESRKPEGTF